MRINIELTQEILNVLTADQAKEILKQFITPKVEEDKVEIKVDATPIEFDLSTCKKIITPDSNKTPFTSDLKTYYDLSYYQSCRNKTPVLRDLKTPDEKLPITPYKRSSAYRPANKTISDNIINDIQQRINNGERLVNICKELGYNYSTIYGRVNGRKSLKKK